MKLSALAATFAAFVGVASTAHATAPAAGVFSVTETIADNGNGTYTYDYALSNLSSAAAAWWFVVVTPDSTSNLTGFAGWSTVAENASGFTPFSGNAVYTWDSADSWPYGPLPHGLPQGQTFSSLSYTSTTYDPSQKQFLVDVQGYWNNPDFSFGGLTSGVSPCPRPAPRRCCWPAWDWWASPPAVAALPDRSGVDPGPRLAGVAGLSHGSSPACGESVPRELACAELGGRLQRMATTDCTGLTRGI